MGKRIAIITAAIIATLLCISSCRNNTGSAGKDENKNLEGTEKAESKKAEPAEEKSIDVVYFANLYCKTSDLDLARIFLGKDTSSLFTVKKDIENNYASVYATSGDQNSLEFYMWTDKDGEKILGVNLTQVGEKGKNRRFLHFFTHDARLNLVVPCKRINEIITNQVMSMRKNIAKFFLITPTSPENENITLKYWDRKGNYNEFVFVWDGKQFNV